MEDKDKKIKELEDKLSEEIAVKKSEVILNKELLEKIEKQNLHINTLQEINEDYSNKIAKLKVIINKINQMTLNNN
jgi:chaperonin cofactor prefoldin